MEEMENLDILYKYLKEQGLYEQFIQLLKEGVDINE